METALDTNQLAVAPALQRIVPELVALTLDAKQAHWNMTGPAFLPLHDLTDEIANDARIWTDRLAERALALGFPIDARPATVATVAGATGQFPAGYIADDVAITELGATLQRVATAARQTFGDLEQADPVAHGIAIEVLEGIEKYAWMLRAQAS